VLRRRQRERGRLNARASDRPGTKVSSLGDVRASRSARSSGCGWCRHSCGLLRHLRGRRRRSGTRCRCSGRSRRRWSRRRRRGDRRSRRGRNSRDDQWGKEEERIHVAVRILRVADAQVDVGDVVLDLPARAYGSDDRSLGHGLPLMGADRAEMGHCHGVAVGRLDRHDFAAGGNGARERDRAGCRRHDRVACRSADVDSAVLPCRVWVLTENEFLEYRPSHGPGPGSRRGDDHEGCRERDDQGSAHLSLLVVLPANRATS
jgi:hypothetical protein